MTFSISTKIQDPCQNIETSNLFPQESLLLGVKGIINCELNQFANQVLQTRSIHESTWFKKTFSILMLNIMSV